MPGTPMKPCPFCGQILDRSDVALVLDETSWFGTVNCPRKRCDASRAYDWPIKDKEAAIDAAIEKWNTRPSSSDVFIVTHGSNDYGDELRTEGLFSSRAEAEKARTAIGEDNDVESENVFDTCEEFLKCRRSN